MAHDRAGDLQLSAQQAVRQDEAGARVLAQGRIEPARDRQPGQDHPKQQDEHQPPEEIRYRLHHGRKAVYQRRRPAPVPRRRHDTRAAAQQTGQQHGHQAQLQRRGQSLGNQHHHVLSKRNGSTQAAVHQLAQPDHKLRGYSLIESVQSAQPGNILRACPGRDHHRNRVARHHPHQHEYDQGHAEQRRYGQQQASQQDERIHGPVGDRARRLRSS